MNTCVVVMCDLDRDVKVALARDPLFRLRPEPGPLPAEDAQTAVGIVVRSETLVDDEMLDRLPRLRFVIRAGSGLDRIDTIALEQRGVALLRNSLASADAVAEIAVVGLVSLARRLPLADALLRDGEWRKEVLLGDDVRSLRAAIWGAGPVGSAIHNRLNCEGVGSTFVSWPSVARSLPTVSVEAALADCDAHLLALPLRAATKRMFGSAVFADIARRTPFVVNVARFELVDMDAAISALADGLLRGLAIDPIDAHHVAGVRARLRGVGRQMNLIVTPHIGAHRGDATLALGEWAISTARQLATEQRAGPGRGPRSRVGR